MMEFKTLSTRVIFSLYFPIYFFIYLFKFIFFFFFFSVTVSENSIEAADQKGELFFFYFSFPN